MTQKLNQRKIAILSDIHGFLEPAEAIFEDINQRKITEIYSLGDNIGVGPNPKEVLNLLDKYNVVSIAGNSEDYITLGIESFSYIQGYKKDSYLWTLSKLDENDKRKIAQYPHSIELLIGGKKIALCHFANDVRFDYKKHSTWEYQNHINTKHKGYDQFLYTNSKEQFCEINALLKKSGINNPKMKGYLSAINEPLFSGKSVNSFDTIIQGHVHWKICEHSEHTTFYSIRAAGIAYGLNPKDTASYVILSETENGFDLEEILVKFDRDKMIKSILNCDSPDERITKYVEI